LHVEEKPSRNPTGGKRDMVGGRGNVERKGKEKYNPPQRKKRGVWVGRSITILQKKGLRGLECYLPRRKEGGEE